MTQIITAAELLANLPAIIGYVPHASISVVTTTGTTVPFTIGRTYTIEASIDLDRAHELADKFDLTATNAPGAILIAICEPALADHAAILLDAVRDALTERGTRVLKRIHAHSLQTAGTWTDLDTGDTGQHVAYTDAMFTAMAVARGRRIAPSREALAAEFSESDRPVPPIAVNNDPEELLDTIEQIAAATNTGTAPALRVIALAARHISDPRVRDSLIVLGLDDAEAAAHMWTTMSAHMRGQARITGLTIAAALFFTAHDAVRTGIALDTVQQIAAELDEPDVIFAQLLDTALYNGVSPEQVLRILRGDHR